MPCYLLYHLNRSSGHIDRVEEIDAVDDVRAVAIVRKLERDGAVELWREGRKVLRLEGSTRPSVPTEPRPFRGSLAG